MFKSNPLLLLGSYVVHAEVNAILNTNHASAAGQVCYFVLLLHSLISHQQIPYCSPSTAEVIRHHVPL